MDESPMSSTRVVRLQPGTMETNGSFPDDLVTEILSWLPVTQLLRFRCVSKSWCAIVDNPAFINKHHERRYASLKEQGHIPMFLKDPRSTRSPWWYLDLSYSSEDIATQLHFVSKRYEDVLFLELEGFSSFKPRLDFEHFKEVSCLAYANGVFLFEWYLNWYCSYLGLWNPATREFRVVPLVPRSCREYWCDKSALGFDPNSNDIKILRDVFRVSNNGRIYYAYEMYSLKTNSWKSIEYPSHPEHDSSFGTIGTGVYINSIHYWPCQKSNLILSFDFCNEIFEFLSQPPIEGEYRCSLLANYKGSLACICYHHQIPEVYQPEISTPLEIWVMSKVDDHGIPSAWLHLFTIGPFQEINAMFCSFRVGGDVLLTLHGILPQTNDSIFSDDDDDNHGEGCLYDPATKKITKRFEFVFYDQCYEYVESLWKLKKRI